MDLLLLCIFSQVIRSKRKFLARRSSRTYEYSFFRAVNFHKFHRGRYSVGVVKSVKHVGAIGVLDKINVAVKQFKTCSCKSNYILLSLKQICWVIDDALK